MYGSGYIYEKNRLGGKIATYVVKTQKEDGDALHLITSCSTNVTLATVQFSLKDNALVPLGPANRRTRNAPSGSNRSNGVASPRLMRLPSDRT